MKFIATLFAVSAVLAVVSASGYGGGNAGAGAVGGAGGSGGYGAASIPSPPCAKNYMFSCQPKLAPVGCAHPSAGYGSAGAYSENIPTIMNAPYGYQQFPNFYEQNVGLY